MLVEILVIVIIIKIGISLTILKISYNKIKEYKNAINILKDIRKTCEKTNIKSVEEIKNLKEEIEEIKEEMEVYTDQMNKEKKTYQSKLDQLKRIREILEG